MRKIIYGLNHLFTAALIRSTAAPMHTGVQRVLCDDPPVAAPVVERNLHRFRHSGKPLKRTLPAPDPEIVAFA